MSPLAYSELSNSLSIFLLCLFGGEQTQTASSIQDVELYGFGQMNVKFRKISGNITGSIIITNDAFCYVPTDFSELDYTLDPSNLP